MRNTLVLLSLLALLPACGDDPTPGPGLSRAAPAAATGTPDLPTTGFAQPLAGEAARVPSGPRTYLASTAADTCKVKWSDLYWDPVARTHYVWFTNGCPVAYDCYVKVTRSHGTNKYGWCVGANSSYRIDVGIVEYGDKVVPGVGDEC